MKLSALVLGFITVSSAPLAQSRPHNGTHSKFLILGAGIAGLSAVQNLVDRGETSFRILEGSERIGGRVKNGDLGDRSVEIGPQWLHDLGLGDDDPILKLAKKAGIVSEDSDLEDVVVFDERGRDVTDTMTPRWNSFYSALESFYGHGDHLALDSPHAPDISQRAALELGGWRPTSATDFAIEFMEMDFNYGQQPELASTRFAYSSHSEKLVVDQDSGMSKIIASLAGEINGFNVNDPRLLLRTKVKTIQYTDHTVEVTLTNGDTYTADYAIVTFSLGVLKSGTLTFDPPLPKWKRYAIASSTYVADISIFLRFPSTVPKFWGDSEYVAFGSGRRGHYTLWQNMETFWPDSRVLQVHLSGEEAKRISRMTSDNAVKAEIMAVLRTMYGNTIPNPEDILVPRWLTDPLFLGSYSDWATSFQESSHDALRAAVGPVYFAGEAYDKHCFGYMQGAYISGKSVSNQILSCFADSRKCVSHTPPYEARGCTYKQANNYDTKALVDDGSCDITVNTPASRVSRSSSSSLVIIFSFISFIIHSHNQ